jgi:hypothetical protein
MKKEGISFIELFLQPFIRLKYEKSITVLVLLAVGLMHAQAFKEKEMLNLM